MGGGGGGGGGGREGDTAIYETWLGAMGPMHTFSTSGPATNSVLTCSDVVTATMSHVFVLWAPSMCWKGRRPLCVTCAVTLNAPGAG